MKTKDCLLNATITTLTGEEYTYPLYVSFDLLVGLFETIGDTPKFIKVTPGETLKSYYITTPENNRSIEPKWETEEVYEILASLGEFTLHTGKPATEVHPVNYLVTTLKDKMVSELEAAYITNVKVSSLKSKVLKEEIKNYLDTTNDKTQEMVKTITSIEKTIRDAALPPTHPYFKVTEGFKDIHTILEKRVTPEVLDVLNTRNEERGLLTERKRREKQKEKEVYKLRKELDEKMKEYDVLMEKLGKLTRSEQANTQDGTQYDFSTSLDELEEELQTDTEDVREEDDRCRCLNCWLHRVTQPR